MIFLDDLTVDEVPCDYQRIAKKFGNKNIRLKREHCATKKNYWKLIKILKRKIGHQKKEIRDLKKILGNERETNKYLASLIRPKSLWEYDPPTTFPAGFPEMVFPARK